MTDSILPTVAELQAARAEYFDAAIRSIGAEIRAKEAEGLRTIYYWPKVNEPAELIAQELRQHGFSVQVNTDTVQPACPNTVITISWS